MPIPEFLGLIHKYLKKTISEDELDILMELLKEEENAQIFKDLIQDDYLLKATNREFDTESALDKTMAKINDLPQQETRVLYPFYKWAAVLAIPIGLVLFWKMANTDDAPKVTDDNMVRIVFDNGSQKTLEASMTDSLLGNGQDRIATVDKGMLRYESSKATTAKNTLQVPYGKHFEVTLTDGTHVSLNAGSSLTYPVSFTGKENREVVLTGEAFFKVSKDAEHPFIVNSGDLAIEVLGTEFNVNAYGDEQRIYTTLREGSVQVSSATDQILLVPNEQTVYEKTGNTMQKRTVDVGRFTAWMDNEIVFTSTSFKTILKMLERQHNIIIENQIPEINEERFTARFGQENIEQIMTYFSKSYGFN